MGQGVWSNMPLGVKITMGLLFFWAGAIVYWYAHAKTCGFDPDKEIKTAEAALEQGFAIIKEKYGDDIPQKTLAELRKARPDCCRASKVKREIQDYWHVIYMMQMPRKAIFEHPDQYVLKLQVCGVVFFVARGT